MIRLIVKGSPSEASNAVGEHTSGRVVIPLGQTLAGDSIFEVDNHHLEKITSWFHETAGPAPYPPGTLLFFNYNPEPPRG